ncbi:hypothetical protein HPULCUR_009378 [Helicostylum pulchrum]|uniref:GATA-type domain-containing protein n=1 Tax=Helicostylum pulchrum TaxID=562976 RepID=A0ABP9YA89_9FUNG
MAPILLKVKGNLQCLPFGNDSTDDLSKTWRVCTKVKDSLENGSRLENLSWRLWFAHNVNNKPTTSSSSNKKATTTTNFKVPDNFDFKAQNINTKNKVKIESMEVEYRRKLSLQQKKQAELLFNQPINNNNNNPPQDFNRQREEFTLQQFTSDQAGDQVIELDDIFKSFGADIQAYLNPTEEQQLDNLINESWPISSSNSSYNEMIHSNATSPINMSFPTLQQQQQQPYHQQQQQQQHQDYYDIQGSALYVSSEAMPPIPIGTLHNKLLATLPRETLESAGKLLSSATPTIPEEEESMDETPPSSSSSSYRFFMPPQQQQINSSFTFSHHHPAQHSKSLPPSRAVSPPPPCDTSTSSSPISPSIPQRRATAPINSSPSEGKAPICSNCSTASTPLWRRSANDELLCNACGLYLKLHNAPRPKYLKPQSSRKDLKGEDENIVQPLCSNCGTSTTPLWRRDLDGAPLCNACGLYLKLHHEKRPLSMKTDNIKKRQRCENNTTKQATQPTTATTKKKNRVIEEPLTTTFESKYQYMEDVVPTTSTSSTTSSAEYSPFGTFGLTLTNQPI